MRRGDYMIHVFIENGKEFRGASDTSDPLVEVQCLSNIKYSQAKS